MLAETGQPFEHVQLGGSFRGLDDPEYLKLNPHGRVPTLCDGDVVVWESNAIIRYVAAKYFSGTMWPEDPAERSYADQWMDWAQTRLYPDFNKLFWLAVRTPRADQDLNKIRDTNARLNGFYRILDNQLEQRDYVAGRDLTMADFPSGATLYRYFEMPIERPELPNIMSWYHRLSQRDAYKQYVIVSFEELCGRPTF